MSATQAELEELSGLIDLVYQGATDPERWDSILAALAGYVDAPYAFLVTPLHAPEAGGYMYSRNIPSGIFEKWARYSEHDIYAREAFARGQFESGNVVTGEDIVPREQFEASVFYRDLLSHYDFTYMLASIVFGKDTDDLLPTTCTYYRCADGGMFAEKQRQRLRLLAPHLSRALGVMQRLRDADFKVAASRASLDLLSTGVLLIGADGGVIFANRSALRLLGEEDGLRLRSSPGPAAKDRLTTPDAKSQNAIDAGLRSALSPEVLTTPHFVHTVSVPRPSGLAPYRLSFSSLSPGNEFGNDRDMPSAIVFISDPEKPLKVDVDWLRKTYGLTHAEIRAALMLTSGNTSEQIAAEIGVSVNTLRTQLQQAYAKTGTGSRAKLVRLLISLSEAQ